MWALVQGAPGDILAHARDVGRIRPGLDDLLDACRRSDLVLASGGYPGEYVIEIAKQLRAKHGDSLLRPPGEPAWRSPARWPRALPRARRTVAIAARHVRANDRHSR